MHTRTHPITHGHYARADAQLHTCIQMVKPGFPASVKVSSPRCFCSSCTSVSLFFLFSHSHYLSFSIFFLPPVFSQSGFLLRVFMSSCFFVFLLLSLSSFPFRPLSFPQQFSQSLLLHVLPISITFIFSLIFFSLSLRVDMQP